MSSEMSDSFGPLNPIWWVTLIISMSPSMASYSFNADAPEEEAIKILFMPGDASNLSLTAIINSSV